MPNPSASNARRRALLTVLAGGLTLAGLSVAGGCTITTPGYGYHTGAVVYSAPPPPRRVVVQRPPAPVHGAVWVNGHYQWNGNQHVWVQGRWVRPRANHVYVQPRWDRSGRGYVYHPGRWQPRRGGGRAVVRVR